MTGTGYSVTFENFVQLLTYPAYKVTIGPLVEGWFKATLVNDDGGPRLQTAAGEVLELREVHSRIQSDPEKQYKLYQSAMGLWR